MIALITKDDNYPEFLPIRRVIQWEHSAAKHIEHVLVMKTVLEIVNFIRSSVKTNHQFRNVVEDLEEDIIPYDVNHVNHTMLIIVVSLGGWQPVMFSRGHWKRGYEKCTVRFKEVIGPLSTQLCIFHEKGKG